jgi:hypothetical protein
VNLTDKRTLASVCQTITLVASLALVGLSSYAPVVHAGNAGSCNICCYNDSNCGADPNIGCNTSYNCLGTGNGCSAFPYVCTQR